MNILAEPGGEPLSPRTPSSNHCCSTTDGAYDVCYGGMVEVTLELDEAPHLDSSIYTSLNNRLRQKL